MEKYGIVLIENNREVVVEMLRRLIKEKRESFQQSLSGRSVGRLVFSHHILAENIRELLRILLIKPDCLEDIFTDEDGKLNVPNDSRVCLALLETKLSKLSLNRTVSLMKAQPASQFGCRHPQKISLKNSSR